MSAPEQPQIYLLTPPVFELSVFPGQLNAVLEAHDVACIRLALATQDEDRISRAADACREVAHAHDVAIVLNNHVSLAERLGLDGVHLSDAAKSVRDARKALGPDAIIGSFCGTSRHDGMTAGEAGADYIAFGPLAGVAEEATAEDDLFAWWSEMIEVPVVAEGGLTLDTVKRLAPITDFFGVGEEIWGDDDPAAALARLIDPIG
ncbi:thiamine phosphate synthase [Tateyamaria sp. ANG-S1]|uniref:thiamine phosphate synthase n=1 Tax=Tateyamaria sp. ANG-S1 TaxID=1577905 RepID=UPI00057D4C7B|nr:thiamine phosphate synthase [Tateyamaria sp. ANG-S1]KIC48732.1 thiamine-phosphate pyrophosphorylase [Tateyamaria sp. ANG-S1]